MEQQFSPPLPEAVLKVLSHTSLAYLATSEDNMPHLSLMNFTCVPNEELLENQTVLIMTTRRDTKKFIALSQNPHCAVLVHDFNTFKSSSSTTTESSSTGTCSVTLYADVLFPEGNIAEGLRVKHLANNPQYAQFISQPTSSSSTSSSTSSSSNTHNMIAVLAIVPTMARICSISDHVNVWTPPPKAPAQKV